jgi:hypothetical protein
MNLKPSHYIVLLLIAFNGAMQVMAEMNPRYAMIAHAISIFIFGPMMGYLAMISPDARKGRNGNENPSNH